MSSTSKALACLEIVQEIFEKLSPRTTQEDDDSLPIVRVQRRLARRTLARAARVCRLWEDPALNVLWRVVEDILDLLRILPAYSGHPHTFTRDITEQEWARFQKYLVRVRDLNTDDYGSIEAFTWTVLRRWCPHGPLLPLLERLNGFTLDDVGFSHTMLLTPVLDHLSMELLNNPSEATMRMVIREMMPVLSQIRSLAISGDPGRFHLIPVLTFTQLQSLEISEYALTPTAAFLNFLLAFPFLRDLNLELAGLENLVGISLDLGFETLQNLTLTAVGLTDVVTFLEITRPPHLYAFTLVCNKFLAYTSMESVLLQWDTLHFFLPSSLLHLAVEFHIAREDLALLTSGGPTAAQLLAPLHSRNDMHTISFTFQDMFVGFTKTDLNSVQTLWPGLTVFEFAFGETMIFDLNFNQTYANDLPTLESVAAFVSAHPQLERLAIPSMSLTTLPDLDSLPSPPNPRLRRLRVPFFLPGPIVKLGLLVDRLYPNLDLTDIRSTLETGYQRGQQFDLFLCGLQAGRRGAYLQDGGRLDDLGIY